MSESQKLIIYPLLVMMLLPCLVALQTLKTRLKEIIKFKIHPQSLAIRKEAALKFVDTRSSDNLLNLFEMPILFYAIAILFFISQNSNNFVVALMWVYVLLRYIHSYIQCTYNKVRHRFYAFVFSFLILFCLIGSYVYLL